MMYIPLPFPLNDSITYTSGPIQRSQRIKVLLWIKAFLYDSHSQQGPLKEDPPIHTSVLIRVQTDVLHSQCPQSRSTSGWSNYTIPFLITGLTRMVSIPLFPFRAVFKDFSTAHFPYPSESTVDGSTQHFLLDQSKAFQTQDNRQQAKLGS